MADMRAERLLRLILLLQSSGQLTARELAERLEVSTRTIQRDLDSLSLSGIPVYAVRGRGGGWTLAKDYRVNVGGLTPAEAASIFVGRTASVLADLGLSEAADTAVLKLLSALPAHARQDAEYARQRILVDHTDWSGVDEAGASALDVLQRGLWEQRKVELLFAKWPQTALVEPLGLVAKHRTWYFVAARPDGKIRTYKVQRIRNAELTQELFDRPDDFDLPAYWSESWATFLKQRRVYRVRLRVLRWAFARLTWAPSTEIVEVEDLSDGWSSVEMLFENVVEARFYLLGMAGAVEVLEPAELRGQLAEAAEQVLHLHANSDAPGGGRLPG
jgi:predicted DNA-binding transcriptional regulator YafY